MADAILKRATAVAPDIAHKAADLTGFPFATTENIIKHVVPEIDQVADVPGVAPKRYIFKRQIIYGRCTYCIDRVFFAAHFESQSSYGGCIGYIAINRKCVYVT